MWNTYLIIGLSTYELFITKALNEDISSCIIFL
nr:MAG TPA: hypothetical protein [Caudoviricetes sp.]